jgi:hypothetical protein
VAGGLGLDHTCFAQAQRVEADRILGIVFPPAHVRNFLDRLQRIIVAGREPGIDDLPCNARRLACAEIGGFDNGAQHALGRNRVFSDVPAIGRQHAAEILRPRAVKDAVDNHASDIAAAQLLRLGREPKKGIDLPIRKQLHRFG